MKLPKKFKITTEYKPLHILRTLAFGLIAAAVFWINLDRVVNAEFYLPQWTISDRGRISITDVKVGDKLLGQDGEWNTVENFENLQPEGLFYAINNELLLYENQSIIANGKVIHVKDIKTGDILTTTAGTQVVNEIKVVQGNYYFYRLTLSGDHTYYLNDILVHNASRYWVGGGSSTAWNATGDTNWSGTSGDKVNKASVPTSADDVYFDQDYTAFGQGGALNFTSNGSCASLNMTGASNITVTGTQGVNIYGNITIPATGVTWSTTGNIYMSGTGNVNIGMTLSSFGSFILDTAGITVTLTGDLNIGTRPLYIYYGILNTNGYQVDCGFFGDGGATNTRGVAFNGSTINCTSFSWTGTSGTSNFKVNSAYTLNITDGSFAIGGGGTTNWPTVDGADAGTINMIAIQGTHSFSGAGKTFNNVNMTIGSGSTGSNIGITTLAGNPNPYATFANLSVSLTAGVTYLSNVLTLSGNIVVNNSLSFSGINGATRFMVYSIAAGTARTITYNGVSAPTAQYVDFQDITAAGSYDSGSGKKWDFRTSAGVGELPGNSEIYCTTADDLYWKKDTTGSWSTAANWDTVEGSGAGDGRVPLPQDTAYFTNNTFTNNNSYTVTQDLPRIGSFDWSAMTRTGKTWNKAVTMYCYGSTYKLTLNLNYNGSGTYYFSGRNIQTLTSNGRSWGSNLYIDSLGGIVRITDNFSCGNPWFVVTNGTFDATNNGVGNYNVSATQFYSGNDSSTIIMGSGTWTMNSWDVVGKSAGNLSSTLCNIIIRYRSDSEDVYFKGGGLTYNNLTYNITGNVKSLIISGSNTFNNFTVSDAPKTVKFTDGTVTTINGALTWNGSAGNMITLAGTGASGWTISKPSGTVNVSYCNIAHSTATGGATWYSLLSNGNINSGGNSGWIWAKTPVQFKGKVEMKRNINIKTK